MKNLSLADPTFDTPKNIDILVGYNYFFSLLRDGRVIKDSRLLAQNTIFGFVFVVAVLQKTLRTLVT